LDNLALFVNGHCEWKSYLWFYMYKFQYLFTLVPPHKFRQEEEEEKVILLEYTKVEI
jgi:hypothetical protein